MRWTCARGCGAQGEKRYPSSADAERYARAFDRDTRPGAGPGTPLSVLPVRLARRLLRRGRR